jgi:phosphate uptake regulator
LNIDHLALLENSKQRRKLQLTGGSTYVVSLPKKWVDDLKIKIGDEVTLIKNPNGSMTLFSIDDNKRAKKSIVELGKDDSIESLKRKIIAIYLAGYRIIEIVPKGIKIQPSHARTIRELTRSSMIGTEIIGSNTESIIIQVLTRLPELSFDVALRRMHLMASNMHRDAIYALEKNDKEFAEEVVKMDDEVDRFSLYMFRNLVLAVQDGEVLFEIGLKNPSHCLGYRTVIKCIERIADHAALIGNRVKYLTSPIDEKTMKKINQLSEDSLKAFEDAITSLIKCDFNLAEKVADNTPKIVEMEEKLVYSLNENTPNVTTIKFILEDIRRTAEYSSDIAEVVIDKNIQSVIIEK